MNWNQLLSGKRFGMEEYHERKHERTDFQRDYDRLILFLPFPPLAEQDAGISPSGQYIRAQPFDT